MRLTRSQIINRAQTWVNARVPYSMSTYYQGYRKDCSGYVSMAWGLGSNQWTGSLAAYGVRISKSQLKPGDMLLFHNPANPGAGSHVVLFGGWANSSKTQYVAYEQTRPHTVKRTTPYAYWNNSGSYIPYRYKNVVEDGGTGGGSGGGSGSGSGGSSGSAFPGASAFGPGAYGNQVTELGRMLVKRGGSRFYKVGPGPRWSEADRQATQAFQKAQGWRGAEADGIPGPTTWRYLKEGKGKNIGGGSGGTGTGTGSGSGSGSGGSSGSAFPGASAFGPGAYGNQVTELGRMLVKRGGSRFYKVGPGPRWSEADRQATQAFQKAQGWRGAEADGIPGPTTWRYLKEGKGKNIGGGSGGTGTGTGSGSGSGGSATTAFPGRQFFRLGQTNAHVSKLGRQLVKKGYGKHYSQGPGPRWTESDRRNVEAFQRAQGWRGADADGYPGPETWKRLFR
ncbi:peptidoglycan-binding protein [Streptomyces venezuelae]|uniref:peptidoglycan-binding protein n=1 Tax=Streptomyces venezuelae TaxID=54571 RepID=UPI00364A71B1